MVSKYELRADERILLQGAGERTEAHIFSSDDVLAIEAALLAERPLLLKGEPGVGKSQLARAAAAQLNRAFKSKVIDSGVEARDLRWTEDPIARLAQAQLVGALSGEAAQTAIKDLAPGRFVSPGPLWWGFNWEAAWDHVNEYGVHAQPTSREAARSGVVVLIDEIDKAESDVPNGLLEALGTREFTPTGCIEPVVATGHPLVIVTTNEERPLPAAFLRRCVVHELKLPERADALIEYLIARGSAHFGDESQKEIIVEAATMVSTDRQDSRDLGLFPLPGQAEFIDLLHAVFSKRRATDVSPSDALTSLRPYFLRKHSELR